MESQLGELLDFLHDKNPNVRQIALSNLLGHTAKESAHRKMFFGAGLKESAAIRDLKLLCRDQTVSMLEHNPTWSHNHKGSLGYRSRRFCRSGQSGR